MHQATGIPQELIDRAASLSAKPTAIQDLIDSMARLSNIYHDVEGNLNEIDLLLKVIELFRYLVITIRFSGRRGE